MGDVIPFPLHRARKPADRPAPAPPREAPRREEMPYRAPLAANYPPGAMMDDGSGITCLRKACWHGGTRHDETGCSECGCEELIAE